MTRSVAAGTGSESGGPKRISRVEGINAAVLAAISIVIIGYMARGIWFHADAWDFLIGRQLTDPASLLAPHAGHWQTPAVLVHQILLAVVGMDYWPWYYIPRLVGYALLSLTIWYTLRRRGADQWLALATLAVILVLASSAWHNASTIGNLIAIASAMMATLLLGRHNEGTPSRRWQLFGILTLAVSSTSLGVAVLGGTWICLIVSLGRLREWWLPVTGATVTYGVWLLTFGERSVGIVTNLTAIDPLEALKNVYVVISTGISDLTQIEDPRLVAVIVLAAIGVVAWAGIQGHLDAGDLLLLGSASVYVLLVLLARVSTGAGAPTAGRYGYNVMLLTLPIVVPHIRMPHHIGFKALVLLPVVPILVSNVNDLDTRIAFFENYSQASREYVETAAVLIQEGEPYEPNAPVDFPRAGSLRSHQLLKLFDSGWSPEKSTDPEVVDEVRGQLRIVVRPHGAIGGTPLTVSSSLDEPGCVEVGEDEPINGEVTGSTTVRIESNADADVSIAVDTKNGTLTRIIAMRGRLGHEVYISFPDPETPATIRLSSDTRAMVCGVTS